jgi:aconitate hydratase
MTPGQVVTVSIKNGDGEKTEFSTVLRLDSAVEIEYYRHGGILPYVIRQMIEKSRGKN